MNKAFGLAIGSLLWITGLLRAADLEWLYEAAKTPNPPFSQPQPTVFVLLDEWSYSVSASGSSTERHRCAIRILDITGCAKAIGQVTYNQKSDDISEAKAWLLRNGKISETRSTHEWIDRIDDDYHRLESEVRSKIISLSDKAAPGDVFAFETCVVYPPSTNRWNFVFSGNDPIAVQRFSLEVPPGFSVEHRVFGPNPPRLETEKDGQVHTWTLQKTPYRPTELHHTKTAFNDSEVFAQVSPPVNCHSFTAKSFARWEDVSAWLWDLNLPALDTSNALAAKAHELADAYPDTLGKIRAVAEFVQKTHYIQVAINLQKHEGLIPHKASSVFANGYGDCKDKSNLLRAMLREIGIEAYSAVAQSECTVDVRDEIPSCAPFNHMVTCIRVDDTIDSPAIVTHPSLGKLLIFDPTAYHTPLGDITLDLQGSKILLLAKTDAPLIQVPIIPPEKSSRLKHKASIELTADEGALIVADIDAFGSQGSELRWKNENASATAAREKFAQRSLNESLRAATLQEFRFTDNRNLSCCSIHASFNAKHFVQHLPGNMLIVKMDVLNRDSIPSFPTKDRHLAIRIPPLCLDEDVSLKLPSGYVVDDLPKGAHITSHYGDYESSISIANGLVLLHRHLIFSQQEIPATDYAQLRQFLSGIARADHCALALKPAP